MLVTFDTQEVVEELKNHGFTDDQAAVLTKIQKKILNESIDNTLASKEDISLVREDIQEVKIELTLVKWMLGIVIAVEVIPLLKQFF